MLIPSFATKCKPKVHVIISSHKEKKHGNLGMGLEWTHKLEFKMKAICTNQKKRWLMQIGAKLMHEWTMNNPTHKTLDLEGAHHSIPYIVYCVMSNMKYIKWAKKLGFQNENLKKNWSCKVMNPTGSWAHNFNIRTIIKKI